MASAMLFGPAAFAGTEQTPWGLFDFPNPVRSQREAQAMYDEARVPIVVAVRFLAITETPDAPWVTRHLACGTGGSVRKDLARTLVRASTELAHQLVDDLDGHRRRAAGLRVGLPADAPVRYAGPVAIVLEPVTISRAGEPLPPPVVMEPHLRVFVTASVPPCDEDATGAFGRLGELSGGFLVTASPALELGWPTSSPNTFGQRIVMATDNALTEGFCCGQEANFALDSLVTLYDFRDFQTKSALRATLRTLATARQRDRRWEVKVRDGFGLPDRYPSSNVGNLRYGSGRIATGEFTVWPVKEGARNATGPAMASLADLVMGLAWHAHTRAELISPAILERYDPERRYSFVGWPEEFRESTSTGPVSVPGAGSQGSGKVLEVFGPDRKLSFVGEAESVADNIAFGFAAWKAELGLFERDITQPFIAQFSDSGEKGNATRRIVALEAEAAARRRPRLYQGDLMAPGDTGYGNALRVLDSGLKLPGFASLHPASPVASRPDITLEWQHQSASLPASSAEELRAGLIRLYRSQFSAGLGEAADTR
jgi:hypothetical protein